ncbi:unnamed protein product [Protopolystoma xenopodis]|uniref:Uncharacterized protein n=1 Tax=Protopolystoma xenopodis TaxID=117903 RepID=A0A3S5AFV8_9PLAT|nr:unnamed protein product [Protopolystoma xenopodis]
MTDESLAPVHRNRRRLPRKQRQHESAGTAKRQLVKRSPPSSSGGTDFRIFSRNTFTRNGSKLNKVIRTAKRNICFWPLRFDELYLFLSTFKL